MSCDEVGNSGIVIQPTEPADVEALLTLENAVFETSRLNRSPNMRQRRDDAEGRRSI
jgi:hypothetical protein